MKKIITIGFDRDGVEAIKIIKAKGFNVAAIIRKLVKEFAAANSSSDKNAKW